MRCSQTTTTKISKCPGGMQIAIVRSSYYGELTEKLEENICSVLKKVECNDVITFMAPGAFEIPLTCKKIIEEKKIDGIIALGLIVDGETHHAEEIARACTNGIMHVQLMTGIPIVHGVLYTKTMKQAEERCAGNGCIGEELASALLRML